MTREEIKEKLTEIMVMAMPDSADAIRGCTEETNLSTDLGLTSVGMLFIVIAIEEFFSLAFENVNFNDFKTVGDVVDYIESKRAA